MPRSSHRRLIYSSNAFRRGKRQCCADADNQSKHNGRLPDLQSELRTEVEIQFQRSILSDLDGAGKGVHVAFFRKTDDNRLRSGFGRVLMLNQSASDLLQDRVVLRRITAQKLTQLLRPEVQLFLLQHRVVRCRLPKLLIIDQIRVISAVIKIQSLATRIQTDDRLLSLKVFQLDACVFI